MRTSSDLVADFKRDHADIYNYVDYFFDDRFKLDYSDIFFRFLSIFNIYDYDDQRDLFLWSVSDAFLDYLKFNNIVFCDSDKASLVCMLEDIEKRQVVDCDDCDDFEADTACNLKLSVSDVTLSKFDQLKKFLKKDYEDDGILVFPFDNDFAFDVMIEMLYSHFIDKSDFDLLESKS